MGRRSGECNASISDPRCIATKHIPVLRSSARARATVAHPDPELYDDRRTLEARTIS